MYCLLEAFSLVISDFGIIVSSDNLLCKNKKREQVAKKQIEFATFSIIQNLIKNPAVKTT